LPDEPILGTGSRRWTTSWTSHRPPTARATGWWVTALRGRRQPGERDLAAAPGADDQRGRL